MPRAIDKISPRKTMKRLSTNVARAAAAAVYYAARARAGGNPSGFGGATKRIAYRLTGQRNLIIKARGVYPNPIPSARERILRIAAGKTLIRAHARTPPPVHYDLINYPGRARGGGGEASYTHPIYNGFSYVCGCSGKGAHTRDRP